MTSEPKDEAGSLASPSATQGSQGSPTSARRPEHGLPVGTLVIERYVYTNRNGNPGVQWLAQIVDEDGDLALMQACRTRREALEVASSPGASRG